MDGTEEVKRLVREQKEAAERRERAHKERQSKEEERIRVLARLHLPYWLDLIKQHIGAGRTEVSVGSNGEGTWHFRSGVGYIPSCESNCSKSHRGDPLLPRLDASDLRKETERYDKAYSEEIGRCLGKPFGFSFDNDYDTANPHVALFASEHVAVNPRPGSAFADLKIKAITVCIEPRLSDSCDLQFIERSAASLASVLNFLRASIGSMPWLRNERLIESPAGRWCGPTNRRKSSGRRRASLARRLLLACRAPHPSRA